MNRNAGRSWPACRVRSGMALVVVLAFSAVFLILASSYLRTFTHGKAISTKQLSQIQMEFFAQGIQRIAIFKFRKFSSQFYRAYRYQLAKDGVPPVTLTYNYSPTPMEKYHGIGANVLQSSGDLDFMRPLDYESYSTRYSMSKIAEFNRDVLEVTVTVKPRGEIQNYVFRASFDASRTAIISGS